MVAKSFKRKEVIPGARKDDGALSQRGALTSEDSQARADSA